MRDIVGLLNMEEVEGEPHHVPLERAVAFSLLLCLLLLGRLDEDRPEYLRRRLELLRPPCTEERH